MSNALAIAAVTATLKDLVNDGLLNHDLSSVGSFTVTAQPPDRITTGETERNQLNFFLYQVMPNSGWRNADLPSRDGRGSRLSNPPLALDLRYLLTAYGAEDLNAEVLLGFAMHLLHETPVLTRAQLRVVLGPPSPVDGDILPGPFGSLSALALADQIEMIKVTPEYLGAEELSKLWTAMQARYRPSMSYLVSVVLIRREGGARVAPPVLQRGSDDRGPAALAAPPPTLTQIRNLAAPLLPAARLGDDLAAVGSHLAREGTLSLRFHNVRVDITNDLPVQPTAPPGEQRVHLPTPAEDPAAMADWAAGVYTVSLRVAEPGQPAWTSNGVPMALAPRITASPLAATAGAPFTLSVQCAPRLRPLQEPGVRLLVGNRELLPAGVATPADPTQPTSLSFDVPALEAGGYPLRLRVDGIDSLPIELVGAPPRFAFDPAQTVTVS